MSKDPTTCTDLWCPLQAARPGSGRCLRAPWQGIFQLFPEISLVSHLAVWPEDYSKYSPYRQQKLVGVILYSLVEDGKIM